MKARLIELHGRLFSQEPLCRVPDIEALLSGQEGLFSEADVAAFRACEPEAFGRGHRCGHRVP